MLQPVLVHFLVAGSELGSLASLPYTIYKAGAAGERGMCTPVVIVAERVPSQPECLVSALVVAVLFVTHCPLSTRPIRSSAVFALTHGRDFDSYVCTDTHPPGPSRVLIPSRRSTWNSYRAWLP